MTKITPQTVHATLAKHMLVDGFDIVFDLEKSHGSYFYDLLTGKRFLDFFSFFATAPVGFNHPRLTSPAMIETLGKLAVNNITNSDLYTVEMAEFVDSFFRRAVPSYMKHSFFVAGGALAVENALKAAMDWKVRKNIRKGYRDGRGTKVLHFEEAFHGRSGYTVSLTNTADPNKHKFFAKFDWPRVVNPESHLPADRGQPRSGGEARTAGHRPDQDRLRPEPRRNLRDHHRADPGRGRRQPFPHRLHARTAPPGRRERGDADHGRSAVAASA